MSEQSLKQRQQAYEYKGYEPELHEGNTTSPSPLPSDVSDLFNKLNTQGLGHHRDPLCVDMNYTKNKYRFHVFPEEKRLVATPQKTQEVYQKWFENDWKKRSMISKLFSILWYLPAHIYRKYFTTADYKFYYNGLISFIDRTRLKVFGG